MNNKKLFSVYTIIWFLFFIVLIAFLWRMVGNEHIINHTGIVRGSSQKVVVSELSGECDDDLILYVDTVIEDLICDKLGYYSFSLIDDDIIARLEYIDSIWSEMKTEIELIRLGETDSARLYELSLLHYGFADDLVYFVEEGTARELSSFIYLFGLSFVVASLLFGYAYYKNNKAFKALCMIDPLTGILSRIGFEKKAKEKLSKADEGQYSLIKIDINEFKLVNSRYGHDKGNELLGVIARGLDRINESLSVCTRTSADNYMILLEHDDDIIEYVRRRLIGCLSEFDFKIGVSEITFVLAGYRIDDPREDFFTIMDKVERVHDYVKENENYHQYWYTNDFLSVVEKENMYVNRLKEAVKNNEFKMFLQPQVDTKTMELIGAESLIRWMPLDGSKIYPDEFIPLFEKKGLVPLLDYFMLEQAAIYIKEVTKTHPNFILSVNFSRITLNKANFAEVIEAIIDKYQAPFENLMIEVTETSFNYLSDTVVEKLNKLKLRGLKLSMDDFGAGFSSLGSLSRLPVDEIKLDRQFLWGMDSSHKMAVIIENIVQMSHKIGLTVVCEGVEKQRDIEFIRDVGCDHAQGYYISRALPKEEFNKIYIEKEDN